MPIAHRRTLPCEQSRHRHHRRRRAAAVTQRSRPKSARAACDNVSISHNKFIARKLDATLAVRRALPGADVRRYDAACDGPRVCAPFWRTRQPQSFRVHTHTANVYHFARARTRGSTLRMARRCLTICFTSTLRVRGSTLGYSVPTSDGHDDDDDDGPALGKRVRTQTNSFSRITKRNCAWRTRARRQRDELVYQDL